MWPQGRVIKDMGAWTLPFRESLTLGESGCLRVPSPVLLSEERSLGQCLDVNVTIPWPGITRLRPYCIPDTQKRCGMINIYCSETWIFSIICYEAGWERGSRRPRSSIKRTEMKMARARQVEYTWVRRKHTNRLTSPGHGMHLEWREAGAQPEPKS